MRKSFYLLTYADEVAARVARRWPSLHVTVKPDYAVRGNWIMRAELDTDASGGVNVEEYK